MTLKSQARLWEDFYDRALAEQRACEPREPLETVKKRVLGTASTFRPTCSVQVTAAVAQAPARAQAKH